jgi:catechol 2,3-dioxygenase-like lactoylglutathione lyase family enzyme/uncharacterized protein YacL (UPF0231 family)
MIGASWVEICVGDFEQSITWFKNVLGFSVVRREANEFAELALGETSILVASDDALYWQSERSRLLPPGQRGSGVEIVLLVENVDVVYAQAQQARADIVREVADHPWHMRQFWVRHPDGYLIRPAQRIVTVDQSAYYQRVAAAFRRDVPRIVDALAEVKQTADRLAQQRDYLGAATIYETLVTEIFEESHLYYNEEEEEERYNYYDEEPLHPEEEGLEEFVEECIDALGSYLADEWADGEAREKCIEVLFNIYLQDVFESHGFFISAMEQLVKYATLPEREVLAMKLRPILAKSRGSNHKAHATFLLDLQKDVLEDEEYLQICRENELTSYLIDRLLSIGRVDEAVVEVQQVDEAIFLGLADLFVQHKQDTVIESLARARIKEKPAGRILGWLQRYYQSKGDQSAELEVTEALLYAQPVLKNYQELRDLAGQLDCWGTLRPRLLAALRESKKITLLILIALDEGDIDNALQLLKGMEKKDSYGIVYERSDAEYYYGQIDIDLKVAQAAEETRPHESIEVYQNRAERIIARRDRKNYEVACRYLVQVRSLYERIGMRGAWMSYIAKIRELVRKLPAMKDEMAKAKL